MVISLRKQNLSVYDIQRELAESNTQISVNALSIMLREEGFARLPRRRNDERPYKKSIDDAPVADVSKIEKLKEYRQSIISEAVTGKVLV